MKSEQKTYQLGETKLVVEYGEMAKQANGAATIRLGDTMVLCTVVCSKEPIERKDMLPLTVNYRERTYAAGKIPGGFFKREGRPRENEILISRLIDRSIRPHFPENWFNDTQVTALVISYDGENDSDIISMNGTSCALMLSDIPFYNPVSAIRIGKIEGKYVINPTISQQKQSVLDLVVCGTEEALCMVEAGANELSESEMEEALILAQKEIKKLCAFQKALKGKEKIKIEETVIDEKHKKRSGNNVHPKLKNAFRSPKKPNAKMRGIHLKRRI